MKTEFGKGKEIMRKTKKVVNKLPYYVLLELQCSLVFREKGNPGF